MLAVVALLGDPLPPDAGDGVSRMIRWHLVGVLNYFEHRIRKAGAEGPNSKTSTIQKMAHRFRNKDHFRTAVLVKCGGHQLHPVTHPIAG